MKLWIDRDSAIIPEDMEHYIEGHLENEIQYDKLHLFYGKPVWKNGYWCCEVELLPKWLPLELNNEGIETLGNYHKSLVNSMYYSTKVNNSYYTFFVTT
jgi:hypothetical protein